MATNTKKNGWLSYAVENIKATPAYLKNKLYSRYDKNASNMMRENGLVGGILGEKNYNTVFKNVRDRLQSGDQIGAYSYVKEQKRKVKATTNK